jgi:23S rRNA (adenine2503-C2)-methyltransferase
LNKINKNLLFDDLELASYAKINKLQPFKVKQILYELYKNQNIDLDEMTTLSKDLRSDLLDKFDVVNLEVDKVLEDSNTTKFSFKTFDGHIIEVVLMYHWSKHQK